MIISDLSLLHDGQRVRASASVHWENCDQPDRDVFFETEEQFSADISPNPHAFLIGCLLPAMHFGERRIHMEVKICPMLQEGLRTVMGVMKQWSNGQYKPLKLEVDTSPVPHIKDGKRHAGMVMSGGIDSLTALRLNRKHYPEQHPASIKDCFFIHGFDIGGVVARGMKYHVFERAKTSLETIAEDAHVTLIPIYTNVRHLCDERALWLEKFFGAVLAAAAHTFDSRINLLHVASSYDIPNLAPCGSHPLLDPYYSSYELGIFHRDLELSRLDKMKIIADWDAAFQNFRVCLANVKDRLNCGKCEKCVRTMAELIAIGALHKTEAFVEDDLSPQLLESFNIRIRHREPFYEEMLKPLKEMGRDDLAQTIERMLAH